MYYTHYYWKPEFLTVTPVDHQSCLSVPCISCMLNFLMWRQNRVESLSLLSVSSFAHLLRRQQWATEKIITEQHTLFFFLFLPPILSSLSTHVFCLWNNNTAIQICQQCAQSHTFHIQYCKTLVFKVTSGIVLTVPHSLSLCAHITFERVTGYGVTSCVLTCFYYIVLPRTWVLDRYKLKTFHHGCQEFTMGSLHS